MRAAFSPYTMRSYVHIPPPHPFRQDAVEPDGWLLLLFPWVSRMAYIKTICPRAPSVSKTQVGGGEE